MPDVTPDSSRTQAREEVIGLILAALDAPCGTQGGNPGRRVRVQNGVDAILDDFPRLAGLLGYVKADESPYLPSHLFADWYATGERGSSSEAIAYRLTSGSVIGSHPWDPSDFRRCEKLLRAVPIARTRLDLVATMSPIWGRLVGAWDELVALGEEEVPGVFSGRATGSAPRMYARMKELIEGEADRAVTQ